MLWGSFYVAKLALEIIPNNNINFIPKEAKFVAKIDGRQLFEKGFRSIVLDEDHEIITLMDEILNRKASGEEQKSLGIAFHSDIIFFRVEIRNEDVEGYIFNLSSQKKFQENISSILKKNQTSAHNKKVGIILSLTEGKESKIELEDLQIQADLMINKKSSFDLKKIAPDKDNSVLQSWYNTGLIDDDGIITNSEVNFQLLDNAIHVNGDLEFEGHKPSEKRQRLHPKNTHLTSTIVSSEITDSINVFFKALNLKEADIRAISINYHGTEIVEEPSFFIVPYIDLLIETHTDYDIKPSIDSAAVIDSDISFNENYFEYGGKKFYFEQISPKLFYIGVTENPEIEQMENDIYLDCSGSLTHLTRFYGEGIMRKFLEIIPLYSASRDLASKIESVEIKIKTTKGNKGNLHGEIIFNDESYALNALIHFAIDGHIIK